MGEKTRTISSILLSNEKVRYITIGTGAIDQNGSYKLELFRKKLPKYINTVAYMCQTITLDHIFEIDYGNNMYDK